MGSDQDKIVIEIDADKLTFGDLELFEKAKQKKATMAELIPLLEKIVVGGIRHIPVARMQEVTEAIEDAIANMQGDPDTGEDAEESEGN